MDTLGPLGLLPGIVSSTSATTLDKLGKVEKFDMQRETFLLHQRNDLQFPDKLIHTVEREFKRFFSLSLLITKQRYPFVPSPPVDAIWHELIVDTMRYEQLCLATYGKFIHHIPNSPTEIAKNAGEIFGYTKSSLEKCYGGLAASVWGIAAACDYKACKGPPHPWPI